MNPPSILPQTAPTWRDVVAAESPRPRPRTRTGRRRLLRDGFRLWAGVALAAVSLAGGYKLWMVWKANPAVLAAPARSAALREIAVRTDGVLDRAWVERTLAIPAGTPLMDLDLGALRSRLLASGQVSSAIVTRRFPDVLGVTLAERSPVLRLHAEDGEGGVRRLFVARDGAVFSGDNYDEELVSGLPWLAGVALTRVPDGAGFAPIHGMESVSELLGTARTAAPALGQRFQVVSLARYAGDGVLVVRTPEVAEIAFSSRDDYFRQLARLDYILDELAARPGAAPVRSINLAVGGHQVPVAFEPVSPARPASRSLPAPAPAVAPRTLFQL